MAIPEGRLQDWVHAFLETAGGNVPFSEGLRLMKRYWTGPRLIPLSRLERCFGPEPTMEYVGNGVHWEARVGKMVEAIQEGWAPPPLIAQYGDARVFSVRDGNHRHEALRRAGVTEYWCVIWCDSEEMRQEATKLLGQP